MPVEGRAAPKKVRRGDRCCSWRVSHRFVSMCGVGQGLAEQSGLQHLSVLCAAYSLARCIGAGANERANELTVHRMPESPTPSEAYSCTVSEIEC